MGTVSAANPSSLTTDCKTRWASTATAAIYVVPRWGTSIVRSQVPSSNIYRMNDIRRSEAIGIRAMMTADLMLGAG